MPLEWIHPFLRAVESGCTVVEASQAAGIASAQAYLRAKSDPDFRAAWDEAKEASADLLEKEARRRAVEGVEEPVVYKGSLTPVWEYDDAGELVFEDYATGQFNDDGEPVMDRRPRQARNPDGSLKWLTIRKPSDALLMFLLKGRRPAVFGTDRQEISGPGGGPIESVAHDPDKRAQRIAVLMRQAQARRDEGDGLTADDIV